jgi:nucleoside-diphosphate-sugar epimerase
MSEIIVTGASGFLGRTLIRRLSGSELYQSTLEISTATCDLMNLSKVKNLANKIERASVVYFAGNSPYHGVEPELFQHNVIQITNFLSIFAPKISHFVYVSSADVYGPRPNLPITEKTYLAPFTSYAVSKLISEYVTYQCSNQFPVAVFRIASAYGEFDDGRRALVGRLIKSMLADGVANISGDGQQIRELTYAEDIASVIVDCLRVCSAGIFNLSSGQQYTINEVVSILELALRISVKRIYHPSSPAQNQYFENSKLLESFRGISFARLESIAPNLATSAKQFIGS